MRKWIIADNFKAGKEEEIIKILLKNRGLKNKIEIEEFLNPKLELLTLNKANLKKIELDKAVARIKKAIEGKEQIIVYTDYDVDGVSSGTIVWEALFDLGAEVLPYVPRRTEEGYGLSKKGIDTIHKEHKVGLIITVDHGVTAREKVEYAKKLGIDVIIIDHHTLPTKLPKVEALIHTTSLCATGIAWFFANYLKPSRKDTLNLDLVALATIADLVPLVGINRILVKYGLAQLNKTKRLGLKELIKNSGLIQGAIGVYEVGHILAPRINASGRLTHALDSLRLLCTKNETRARQLAQNLSLINRERQLLLEEAVVYAKESIKSKVQSAKLIFTAEKRYNQGIIGLVAGKLVEEYYRPSIVVARGEKHSKASARSIAGFNIVEAIRSCSSLLVDVGGHPMAAGFTVETSKLTLLKERLTKLVESQLNKECLQKILKIDCEINLEQVNEKLYKRLKEFEPFGIGNPQPTFVSEKVKIVKMRLVGKEKNHLKLTLQPNPKYHYYIEAIGFGMGNLFKNYSFDKTVNIAYTINEDNWNSHREWTNLHSALQLKLKDVILSD